MLNNPYIEKITAGVGNQFLINSMPQKAVGCRVPASLANGEDGFGRAIVKMGTPVSGDLTDRQVLVAAAGADDAVGVLIHDVPVWNGDANGSLLIDGGIILEYADEDVQALIEATNLMAVESNVKVITRK